MARLMQILNRLMAPLMVLIPTVGFLGTAAYASDEEKSAIELYNARRYQEAAALFKTIHNRSATDYYYLAMSLAQSNQRKLANDYFWKALETNAGQTSDPQMAKLCQQALTGFAWSTTIKLKDNAVKPFTVAGPGGKPLVDGSLAYGSKGLTGKIDGSVEVHMGRFVLPGLSDKAVNSGMTMNLNESMDAHRAYRGGGVNIVVNRSNLAKIVSSEESQKFTNDIQTAAAQEKSQNDQLQKQVTAIMHSDHPDISKASSVLTAGVNAQEDAKLRAQFATPQMVITFTNRPNKDGSYDVYLLLYPFATSR